MTAQPTSTSPFFLRVGKRTLWLLVLYSLLWLVLSGADPVSWVMGIPAVIAAVGVSFIFTPAATHTINPAAALLFIPYFIGLSVVSGLDVMRRTFSREPRINPGIFTYRTGLEGGSRILLANIISLLPGTLSADLKDDAITIHVLDREIPAEQSICDLEARIASIFRQKSAKGEVL